MKDLNISNALALVAMLIIVSHKGPVRSKSFLASFLSIAKSFLVSWVPELNQAANLHSQQVVCAYTEWRTRVLYYN